MRQTALLLAGVALLVSGCATPVHRSTEALPRGDHAPRIVLMPLDLELSEVSAGGVHEPKAEWTEAARKHVVAAIESVTRARGMLLVPFQDERDTDADRETVIDLIKLHRAVGGAVLTHHYQPGFQLPSKQGRFDWSLGPEVTAIARSQEADYALFLFMRDSYASSGLVAVMVVSALLGVGIQGGVQVGFASLVDLNSGEIVWFNRFVRGTGDLRTAAGARETISVLLAEAPK